MIDLRDDGETAVQNTDCMAHEFPALAIPQLVELAGVCRQTDGTHVRIDCKV